MSTILAANVAAIRKRMDLNQTDFAALLDATRAQVSNWERGRTAPPTRWLLRLVDLSGVDVKSLHEKELPRMAPAAAPVGNVRAAVLVEIKAIRARLDALEQLVRDLPPLP